jgi:hypothetical protein
MNTDWHLAKVEVHDDSTGNNYLCPCDLWFGKDKSKDGGLLRRTLKATFTSCTKSKPDSEEEYGDSLFEEESQDQEEALLTYKLYCKGQELV